MQGPTNPVPGSNVAQATWTNATVNRALVNTNNQVGNNPQAHFGNAQQGVPQPLGQQQVGVHQAWQIGRVVHQQLTVAEQGGFHQVARAGNLSEGAIHRQLNVLQSHHPQAHQLTKQVFADLSATMDLMIVSPATGAEYDDARQALTDHFLTLNQHKNDLNGLNLPRPGSNTLRQAVVADIDIQLTAIADRLTYLQAMRDNSPMSERNVFHAKSFDVTSALKLVDAELQVNPNNTVLQNAKTMLQNRLNDFAQRTGTQEVVNLKDVMGAKKPDKGTVKQIEQQLAASNFNGQPPALPHLGSSYPGIREDGLMKLVLQHVFQAAGLNHSEGAIERAMHGAHIEALNEQNWNTITKQVQFTHNHQHVTYTSEIAPQSQLGNKYADMNGHGINCHCSKEYHQAANVASTEISNANGDTLFKGIRHGVLCAYGITPKEMAKMDDATLTTMVSDLMPNRLHNNDLNQTVQRIRTDKGYAKEAAALMRMSANLNRVKDLATTALIQDPAKLQQALQGGGKGAPVELDLASISLLTPDKIRSRNGMGGSSERLMIEEQMRALQQLGSTPKLLTVRDPNTGQDKKVLVKVNVSAFNFGVNAGAVNKIGPLRSTFEPVGGWNKANEYNRPAMNALIGDPQARAGGQIGGKVGQWLAQNPNHAKAGVVRELAQQVGDIWDRETYKHQGNEPYKMVSRLAMLTHLIGDSVAFNCKSGKDRTGELDVEAKLLATQIDLTGHAPTPDQAKTPEQQAQFYSMAINSGNHEMQQLNTGGMGFKLEGVDALSRQMGSGDHDPHVAVHRGIAKYFAS